MAGLFYYPAEHLKDPLETLSQEEFDTALDEIAENPGAVQNFPDLKDDDGTVVYRDAYLRVSGFARNGDGHIVLFTEAGVITVIN